MNQPHTGKRIRLGCVSFLNSKPLIDGIETLGDVDVELAVPSVLLDELLSGQVDMALCPVINYQQSPEPLAIVPVGGIGCAGPTLTVRLFSRVPFEQIRHVCADTDSHTSVTLTQVVLHRMTGQSVDVEPLKRDDLNMAWQARPPAMLLIGDKVVTHSPPADDYPWQLDLGEAWQQQTGMPFVFATWMALPDTALGEVPAKLDGLRRWNAERLDAIVEHYAAEIGWPAELARQYLGRLLRYHVGPVELNAMEQFWHEAHALGLIEHRRSLQLHRQAPAPSLS